MPQTLATPRPPDQTDPDNSRRCATQILRAELSRETLTGMPSPHPPSLSVESLRSLPYPTYGCIGGFSCSLQPAANLRFSSDPESRYAELKSCFYRDANRLAMCVTPSNPARLSERPHRTEN